jgi:GH35 family endo-1,4-beta-xylanase
MKRTGTIAFVLFCVASISAQALTFATNDATIKQSAGHGHLAWNGEIAEYLYIPADGLYQIEVSAAGMPMGGAWPLMAFRLNFVSVMEVTVNTTNYKTYSFSAYLTEGTHAIGVAFTNDASDGAEDRNLLLETVSVNPAQDGGAPSLGFETDWEASAQVRDQEVLAATDAAIEANRKSPAEIVVVNQHGQPVAGATVAVSQTDHDFLFGCNMFTRGVFSTKAENDAYDNQFTDVFNYATLPFYWTGVEAVDGAPDYAMLDGMVQWCEDNNITMKGHAVLYGDPAFVPAWAGDGPSVQRQMDHVTEIFNRYGGSIDIWDLVNEPYNAPGMDFDAAYLHADSLAPQDNLVVNSYGQFYNLFDMFFANGHQEFYRYMQDRIAADIPLDSIGLQAHAPLDTAFRLDLVQAHLDRYAQLGKDIHITEFSPTSNGQPVLGAPWRGTWTEQTQAEFAEDFYRVAFAHPDVTAITWWDFADIGAWLQNGGLLRSDLTPKPAYNTLKHLIREEWMTDANGAADAEGTFTFSGFHGAYDVSVSLGDETILKTMNVVADSENVLTVVVTTEEEEEPVDTTKPVITMLGSPVVTQEVFETYTDAGATATDDVDGDLTSAINVNNTVDTSITGLYTVDYSVSDAAGNAADAASRMVWITDSAAPVIALNGSASLTVEAGQPFVDPGATATDNYDTEIIVNVAGTVDSNTLGLQTITYTASDEAGNPAAPVAREVTVQDTQAPTLTLLGATTMEVASGSTFSDPGATATDSFEGNLTGAVQVTGSVDTSTVGVYELVYAVADSSGNTAATATRTVTVTDKVAPVITLNGDANVNVAVDSVYADAGATASDNYDADITVVVSGNVNTSVVGTYTITYSATDSSGNTAAPVTRTVTVGDNVAPVISLNGSTVVNVSVGSSYTDAGATATDNHDSNVTVVVSGIVNAAVIGTYTITYTATDSSGNAAAPVTRTVTVLDTVAPVIALLGETELTISQGDDFNDPGANANDNYDGSVTVTVIGAVDTSTPGVYTLTYIATDSSGNIREVTRTVTVEAVQEPDTQPEGNLVGIIGDVDNNGVVEAWDAKLVGYLNSLGAGTLNWYLNRLGRNPAVAELADVDQNGVVDGWDYQVLHYVLQHGLEAANQTLAANGKPLAHVGEELWMNNQMASL